MTHSYSQFSPLGRWQHLRWVLVLALPLASLACKSRSSLSFQARDAGIGPLQTPDAAIGPLQTPDAAVAPLQTPDAGTSHMTEFSILLSPQRAIDILFTIDNSPSMEPKQKALANNFPKMITALMALPGGLPDVHIGVVSSNMGAGSGAMGGNCGTGLGDRGLLWGNDPNDPVASVADNGNYFVNAEPFNPPPALIASGCGLYPGARWIEDIQAPSSGTGRQRNYSTNLQLADVFSCLAKAVGISGCGQEHQLQATRVALIPQSGINDANNGFVRSNAYLAIVLVTDEDDCSATPDNATNDNIFDMVGKRNPGDTTSVRCAARGDLCGGQPIPDYDPSAGYMGTGFTHDLFDCTAKSQRIPADYVYMPLIDVQQMIDSVSWVKGFMAPQRILVSGIIGWPPDPNDASLSPSVQINTQWRIGKDATSFPQSQKNMWDYMPICLDPTQTALDGNIYKAYGGLRLKKFIDAYGANGQTFSICNSDFTNALTKIGQSIAAAMPTALQPGCVPASLIGTNPNTYRIIGPDCQAYARTPCDTPGVGGCLTTSYTENPLPECKDALGSILDPSSLDPNVVGQAQVDATLGAHISQASRPCWYLSYDNSASGCASSYKGQKISALYPEGTVALPGTMLAMQCLTCAAGEPQCPAQ
jgi:hypothetical protein